MLHILPASWDGREYNPADRHQRYRKKKQQCCCLPRNHQYCQRVFRKKIQHQQRDLYRFQQLFHFLKVPNSVLNQKTRPLIQKISPKKNHRQKWRKYFQTGVMQSEKQQVRTGSQVFEYVSLRVTSCENLYKYYKNITFII